MVKIYRYERILKDCYHCPEYRHILTARGTTEHACILVTCDNGISAKRIDNPEGGIPAWCPLEDAGPEHANLEVEIGD